MTLAAGNPFTPILEDQGLVILDGGLATTLEDNGHDLDDDLWSARFLMEDPEAIRSVSEEFLRAGADVITTATYQATLLGLEARGMGPKEAAALIRSGVDLGRLAIENVMSEAAWDTGRPRPLVAASVGPYGAYLADGSEYDGRYGLTRSELSDFHRPRWEILATSGADLLACETLPSILETEALLDLLGVTPDTWAWLSFCCRDEAHLWDGTPLREAALRCNGTDRVAGVGINCTDPRHVPSLLQEARKATSLPLIVYPNSGETYDATTRAWLPGQGEAGDYTKMAATWRAAGAAVIGGCCRVGPKDIEDLRRNLLNR